VSGLDLQPADAPGYPVQSVAKALEILLMLRDRETIGVTEASRDLGIARSTAHRLLRMLEHYEFAQRHPRTRGYRAGPALVSLGLAAVMRMDIRRQARPLAEIDAELKSLEAEIQRLLTEVTK
jgi:IclR family transcriptional regulator, acetate operon repressor